MREALTKMAQHPWTKHDKVLERGMTPSIDGDDVVAIYAANGVTSTFYTVPANKIFLLFDWVANLVNNSGVVINGYLLVYSGAAATKARLFNSNCLVNVSMIGSQSYFIPIPFIAGDYFRANASAVNGVLHGQIHGILINA